MNLFFLVEGRSTEMRLYPKWIEYYFPEFTRVSVAEDAKNNNYYIVNGNGNPGIYKNEHIKQCIEVINELGRYDFFIIALDSEEFSVEDTIGHVESKLAELCNQGIYLDSGKVKDVVIVQERCIESVLLGNNKLVKLADSDSILGEYLKYYDIFSQNPEKMGRLTFNTHAQFHKEYLKCLLKSNGMKYSESHVKNVGTPEYFSSLMERNKSNSDELKTIGKLMKVFEGIKKEMSLNAV